MRIISATRDIPSFHTMRCDHFTSSFQHHAATTSSLAVARSVQVPLWALLSTPDNGAREQYGYRQGVENISIMGKLL